MKIFIRQTGRAVALGVALTHLLSLPAWSQDPAVVATIDGQDVSLVIFQEYVRGRIKTPYAQITAEQKTQFLNELVDLMVVADDAREQGLDKGSEIAARITIQNSTILAQEAIGKLLDESPISEAEIQAAYAEHIKSLSLNEYKARHILHETEAEAVQTVTDLKGGADFETLAQERSTGPSASSGGDLGWFSTSQMVKPFGDAVIAAEPGTLVPEPVQTQFGWHVILVEEHRAATAPPIDELRQSLTAEVQKKKLDAYLVSLHNSMKVEKKL